MAVQDFILNSDYDTDLIFNSGTYTSATISDVANQFNVFSFSPIGSDGNAINMTEAVFFDGIYSYDGGSTWNNISTASTDSKGLSVVVSLTNRSDGSFGVSAYQQSLLGRSYKIIIKYALFLVNASQSIQNRQVDLEANLVLNSDKNYRKVFKTGNYTVASGTAHTETIAHNLGYLPYVAVYKKYSGSGAIEQSYLVWNESGTKDSVVVDSSNVTITNMAIFGVGNITFYYTIYFEGVSP